MRPPEPTASAAHLILTRFSVKFVATDQPFPVQWLEDRLRLLEAYALPGLAAQTRAEFKWLLLCDEATDPTCLNELARLIREVPGSDVILTSRTRSALPEVLRHVDSAADILITTRMDSDDALAIDFVERTQRYVGPFGGSNGETLLVNFSQGRTLETEEWALYDSFQPNSPFTSLFEKVRPDRALQTVYSGNHGHLYLRHPLHIDASHPAWLQVLHGHNVSNHVRKIDIPTADYSPGPQFVIRPSAARQLHGVAAPHGQKIKATGEQGTEGFGTGHGNSEAPGGARSGNAE